MAINNLSFVIASKSPKDLAIFYALLIEGELRPGSSHKDFCIFTQQGINIYIYQPTSEKDFPIRGNVHSLCLNSESQHNPLEYLEAWINNLIDKGATISDKPKSEVFGAEAWLKDPEDNLFLIFVPKKNYK